MSLTDMLSAKDIDKVFEHLQAGNLFEYKKFLQEVGVSKKSAVQIRKIYDILDTNKSGFIEEDDAEAILRVFKPGARKLTAAETADFMKAGDPNNTGKISLDGFMAMVEASKNQN